MSQRRQSFVGFGGGIDLKRRLLRIEAGAR